MHIMVTQDIRTGTVVTRVDRKATLDKLADWNGETHHVLSMREATFNDMQAEVERLEGSIRMNEISLADAPMHGGYSNKLNISTMKTRVINLNAAIAGIAEDKLLEDV